MAKELYHQLNPVIRLKETELLNKSQFDQLIQAESFQEIEEILQQTIYAPYLSPAFSTEAEAAFDAELLRTVKELIDLTPQPEIIWIYTMRYTFHDLKILSKAQVMDKNYDHLLISDGFYTTEQLTRAVATGESENLPEVVMTAIRTVREYLKESKILQGIDVIYDRYFLQAQKELANRMKVSELIEAVTAFIDFTNIITAARCIIQERSGNFMNSVLSSSGSIAKQEFLEFAGTTLRNYILFLKQTEYAERLAPVLAEDEIDFAQLDLIKDNLQTEIFEVAQTKAYGPLPLLAFLNAKDRELQNLRLIMIGKRSGFTPEQMKERMREIYGS